MGQQSSQNTNVQRPLPSNFKTFFVSINENPHPNIAMESIKQAANYVSESIQGATSGASKEANKEVAKDPNVNVSTRATAAKDAVGDKVEQHGHDAKADVHKEAAKN